MSNTPEQDKILSRVRKMLNLANDAAASQGERDNAIRMAHALLAKHGLDIAAAEAAGQAEEEGREQHTNETRDQPWARSVSHAIASLFFCRYYYARTAARGKVRHHFIGRISNATTASELAAFVVASIMREANREWKKQADPGPWWTSFCKGAADRVRERCEELRKAAEQPKPAVPGTALVLADYYRQEHAKNTQFLEAAGIHLRTKRTFTKQAGEGYGAGRAYGDKVSLNRQIGSSGGKGPLRLR